MRRLLLVVFAIALVAPSLACDNSDSQSGITTPTVPLTSQTFTGTVQTGGASSNTTFVVAQNGEVDITVSALGPPPNIIMGLAIGIPSPIDQSCQAPVGTLQVQASTTPLVGSETAGTYCVKLYDIGYMAPNSTVNYTIIVGHP
jgi:hypothetical protein